MNSQVSNQTLFSNLPLQDITSSEFSHFMGMKHFVKGAPEHYDLYKSSAELVNLVGPTSAIISKEKAAAPASLKNGEGSSEEVTSNTSEKSAANEEQSTTAVDFGMQVLFSSSNKKRVYTRDQVKELLFLVFESKMSASKASKLCGINSSTAYGYVKQVKDQMMINKGFEEYTSASAKTASATTNATATTRGNKKLVDVHYKFLVQLFQKDEFVTLASARSQILEKFPGLKVSTSCIHTNLRQNCALVVKCSFDAGSIVTLNRSMMFEEEVMLGMSFFTMYLRSSFGWSKGRSNDGEPASARLSGIRVPLLVAFTSTGIVQLSVVSPVAVAKEGATSRKQHYKHFNEFLENTVAALGEGSDRTFVIEEEWLMNNKRVQESLASKGYKCLYRPTAFVGTFFHHLQIEMRRQQLSEDDPLLPRLAEAAKKIKWA